MINNGAERGSIIHTYNVKQIADILDTNLETVRRWIRENKLKAVQVSRKNGNVVTEDELKRFVQATPKYLSKYAASLTALTLLSSDGLLARAIVTSALLGYFTEYNKLITQVTLKDFKKYLQNDIQRLNTTIEQKQNLMRQTKQEIDILTKKINQYKYLLEHDTMLTDILKESIVNSE